MARSTITWDMAKIRTKSTLDRHMFRPISMEKLLEMLEECNFELSWQRGEEHEIARIYQMRRINIMRPRNVKLFYNKPTNKVWAYVSNNFAMGQDRVVTSAAFESSEVSV